MKICVLFACLLTLLFLGLFASATITITGADAVMTFGLAKVEIPTNKVPLDEIFISGEDAVTNIGLSPVEIPTNITPLTDIFISGEDAVTNLLLSPVEIPTNITPLTDIFISGEDAVSNLVLIPVEVPTNITPLTDIFISGEGAVTNVVLSKVEVPTNITPLTDIFISGEDAVTSFSLDDPWRGNATISVASHIHGETVYSPSIIVQGTAYDESGIDSVRVNGIEAGGSNWSANISLEVGWNIVMIVVKDGSGEFTTKSFSVWRVEPFVFVHMTDVHVGYSPLDTIRLREEKAFIQSIERFADTLQAIKSHNPEFILSPGDMVEWNNEDFFRAYNGILESINTTSVKIPVYNTPGNHDRREWDPLIDDNLTNYDIYITNPNDIVSLNDSFKDYYFDRHGYRFIGLDSGADYNISLSNFVPLVNHDGSPEGDGLKNSQLGNLTEIDSKMPKIIFTHHPIIDNNNDTQVFECPETPVVNTCPQYGGNDACIAFNRCKFINYSVNNNVNMVLTGHTHKDYIQILYDNIGTYKTQFIQTRSATKEDYGYRLINITKHGLKHISYSTEYKLYTDRYTYWGTKSRFNAPLIHVVSEDAKVTGKIYGAVKREIPDSYYTGELDNISQVIVCYGKEPWIVVAQQNRSQFVNTKSTLQTMNEEQDYFTMGMKHQTEGMSVKYLYENITLGSGENATASVNLSSQNTNHTMDIDYNGDGNVDNSTQPTQIIINHAPVMLIETPTGELIDNVTINYTLSDNQSDNCTIIAQYSLDNLTWFSATVNETLVNITSNQTGKNHILMWLAGNDLEYIYSKSFFRIKPYDGELGGYYAVTNAFFVGEEPTIQITPKNTEIFPGNIDYATVTLTPNGTYHLEIKYEICKITDENNTCNEVLLNPSDEISVVFNNTNNLSTTTDINGKAIIKIILNSSSVQGTKYKYFVKTNAGTWESTEVTSGYAWAIPEITIIFLIMLVHMALLMNKRGKLI